MHDFVAKCLDKDAMARSGAGELLKHPFLKRAKDERFLAQRLLGRSMLKPSRSAFHMRNSNTSLDSTLVQSPAVINPHLLLSNFVFWMFLGFKLLRSAYKKSDGL